jgi:hypothetical protein
MDRFTISTALSSKKYTLLFFIISMISLSCGESSAPEDVTDSAPLEIPRTHVLILMDKTLSLSNDSLILKFEQPLRSRLVDLISLQDDEVSVHYIHGNTGGAQAVYQGVITEAKPTDEELEKLGGASRKDREKEYKRAIDRQRFQISDGVKTALTAPNPEKTKLQTDLWATLETMSRTFSGLTAYDHKYVIFVSDMEESMKGEGRRDFTKKAPADKAEAEAWAREDLEVIKQLYKVQPEVIAGTHVMIYLPKEAQQAGNFQTVLYYWEAIFKALGIPDPEVRGIEIGL